MKTITVTEAIAMLSQIAVNKEGFAAMWKLTSVHNSTVCYILVRDEISLAAIYLKVNTHTPYLREIYSVIDLIHDGATIDIHCDKFGVRIKKPINYIVIKDDPLTQEQFLDKYGDKKMVFYSIDDLRITYQNANYSYKVTIDIGRYNEFKPQETANSLFKIADHSFFEFTFD